MKETIGIIAAIVFGLFAFFVGKKFPKKAKEPKGPPENKTASAASKSVQESFEENISRVKSATDSDSPADDLATLGNARRRR